MLNVSPVLRAFSVMSHGRPTRRYENAEGEPVGLSNGGKEPLRRNPGWNAGGLPIPLPRMKKTQATAAAWQHGNREGVFCAPRAAAKKKLG